MAAMLARKGFTANPDAFEHKQGFLALFSDGGRYDVSRVFENWGEPLQIVSPGAGYKLYPCCYATHSAIQGALSLVKEHGVFDPDKIVRVTSRTSARGLAHTDRANPRSNLEAKFSVQYCVARALTSGKVVLDDFEGESYKEPAVQKVLSKVQATPYEGPFFSEDRADARVEVTLKDGRVLEAKVNAPLGRTSADPIPTEALDAKFRDCAGRALSAQQAESVLKQMWALESVADVKALTKMLETRGGGPLKAAA
jgi:2-methylcitrate dehydratase PrpD